MNTEIKKQWVEALRSGNYEQGTRALRRVDPDNHTRYCCLGVLSDLAVKQGVCSDHEAFDQGGGAYLIPKIMEWASLPARNPSIIANTSYSSYSSLVFVNDVCKFSFTGIADLIEKQL